MKFDLSIKIYKRFLKIVHSEPEIMIVKEIKCKSAQTKSSLHLYASISSSQNWNFRLTKQKQDQFQEIK